MAAGVESNPYLVGSLLAHLLGGILRGIAVDPELRVSVRQLDPVSGELVPHLCHREELFAVLRVSHPAGESAALSCMFEVLRRLLHRATFPTSQVDPKREPPRMGSRLAQPPHVLLPAARRGSR